MGSLAPALFNESLQVLEHFNVLGVLVSGAIFRELIDEGGVDAALLHHVHEQVVQVAVQDVSGNGVLLIIPLAFK